MPKLLKTWCRSKREEKAAQRFFLLFFFHLLFSCGKLLYLTVPIDSCCVKSVYNNNDIDGLTISLLPYPRRVRISHLHYFIHDCRWYMWIAFINQQKHRTHTSVNIRVWSWILWLESLIINRIGFNNCNSHRNNKHWYVRLFFVVPMVSNQHIVCNDPWYYLHCHLSNCRCLSMEELRFFVMTIIHQYTELPLLVRFEAYFRNIDMD